MNTSPMAVVEIVVQLLHGFGGNCRSCTTMGHKTGARPSVVRHPGFAECTGYKIYVYDATPHASGATSTLHIILFLFGIR